MFNAVSGHLMGNAIHWVVEAFGAFHTSGALREYGVDVVKVSHERVDASTMFIADGASPARPFSQPPVSVKPTSLHV